MEEQTIELPLKVGSQVTLLTDIDIDEDGGSSADILYEATVEQYVPETALLRMSDGTGRAEFLELVDEADGYEVLKE